MKALVAGLGSVGQRHVRNLRAVLGDQVTIGAYRVRGRSHVITDRMEIDPAGTIEERYAVTVWADLDEALAEAPDVVFVCTPSSLHMPIALRAAQAGRHLFVEKPLSHTYQGVEDLIALVDARGLVAMVGYQFRFHPCFQRVQAWLSEGAIGRVVAARVEVGEYLPDAHRYEDYRQVYTARRELGGGVILSQSHELDYVYALFGLPRKIVALGGRLSHLDVDVEDTASLLLECVVDGRAVPVHIHQDFVQPVPTRTCQVIGEDGTIWVDFHAPSARIATRRTGSDKMETFPEFQRNDLFLAELRHLLACLRAEERPRVTVREGAQSLRIALAAKESLETGRAVMLS